MKYYHSDTLTTEAKKHTGALLFLQRVVKGYVARERYLPLVTKYRGMAKDIGDFLGGIEHQGLAASTRSHALKQTDDTENEKRPWLEVDATIRKKKERNRKTERKEERKNENKRGSGGGRFELRVVH